MAGTTECRHPRRACNSLVYLLPSVFRGGSTRKCLQSQAEWAEGFPRLEWRPLAAFEMVARGCLTDRNIIMISKGNHSTADGARIPGGLKNSGIMVLAADRKVLYINQAGRDLLLRLNGTGKRHAPGGLPKPLAALVEEIQASREVSIEHRGWRRFGPKRLLEPQGRFLFVQAFVQPREPHRPRPVMVLTMQSGETPAPSMEREDPGR